MKQSLIIFLLLCSANITLLGQRIKFRAVDAADGVPEQVDSFTKLHIVIAGNIYKSEAQIRSSFNINESRYDFSQELKQVNPILNIGNLVIAQLKTSFTNDYESPYSAPDEYALSLKYSGINLCMLANKNTINIDKKGLLRTQRALGMFDIRTTGAYTDNYQRNGNYPLFVESKGFKVAILNYVDVSKRPTSSLEYIVNQLDQFQIERDMKLVRDQNPDYTIVYIDWGENYQDFPSYSQEMMAKFILEQGANLIVGTFPNTVQKIDIVQHYYQAKIRYGIVAYSLGNLVSGYNSDREKAGALLDLELLRNNFTGEVKEGDYGFIPVWNYYDSRSKLHVLPVAAVEQKNVYKNLPTEELDKMLQHATEVRGAMGRYVDEIQYNLSDIIIEDIEESIQLTNSPINNKLNPFSESNLTPSLAPVAKKSVSTKNDTIFRIQFYELTRMVPIDTVYYDHLKGYEVLREGESFKYMVGYTKDFENIKNYYFREIRPRYKQAIVVVYVDGKRIREITPVP